MIDVRQASVVLDGQTILEDITIAASERRIGIVGRNGSGKSTLARVLSGLVAADTGSVTIAGVDVFRQRQQAVQVVGILFQNPDHQILFPTVLEEIRFGLMQTGAAKDAANAVSMAMLNRFNKAHWKDLLVQQLSEGQRHLVCVMSVAVMQPQVIILDEPFSGLDIPTTIQLTRYLSQLDCVLLHISHDPRVVQDYDRILWLQEGRIVADGPATETLAGFVNEMKSAGEQDDIAGYNV